MEPNGSPSTRRPGRRLWRRAWIPALGLVGLAAIGAAALAWRLELAEAGLRYWLAGNGFPDARVTVTELGWQRAVLQDLDLGAAAPAAETVVLRYTAGELWRGELASVRIVQPRAAVDLDAPPPWLGGLRRPAGEGGAGDAAGVPGGGALPVERLAVERGELRIRGFGREAEVAFDGRLHLAGNRLALHLEGHAATAGSRVRFSAGAEGRPSRPRVQLEVEGALDAAEMPWPTASALRPASGMLELEGRYRGRLEAVMPAAVAAPRGPPPGRLQLEVGLRDWRIPGVAESLNGRLALRSEGENGPLKVQVSQPLRLAGGPDAAFYAELGLGEALARQLARVQRLAVMPPASADAPLLVVRPQAGGWRADARFRLEARPPDGEVAATVAATARHERDGRRWRVDAKTLDVSARNLALGPHSLERARFSGRAAWGEAGLSLDGRLDGTLSRLAVGGHSLGGLVLEAPVSLRARDGMSTVSVSLSGAGRLSAASLPAIDGARIEGPLEISLLSGEASMGDGVASGRLRLRPDPVGGVVAGAAGPGTRLELSPGVLELVFHDAGTTALRLIAEDAGLRLPGPGLSATGLAADVSHALPQGLSGRLTLTRLSHEAASPAFAPMRIAGALSGELGAPVFEGSVEPAQGGPRIPLVATHDLNTGRGAVAFGPATMRFSPGALSPADLVPPLAVIDNTTGELRLDGELPWGEAAEGGRLTLALAGADFDVAGLGVRGLTTELEFLRLLPPRTAPDQQLTVRALQAGLSLNDIRARFALAAEDASKPPAIDLTELEADFAGGSLRVENTLLDPGGGGNAATVRVADVALERLLAELGLGEDVTGEGRLSGRIPVRLEPGGVVIADGELRAGGPGRLQVRLRETGQALGQQAREMELMIRALEDFRYEVLAAELERDADGELRLALRLEGSNPEVLEGHPFRFNITLSGNLDPVFRALRLGGDIGSDFLREHLQLQ